MMVLGGAIGMAVIAILGQQWIRHQKQKEPKASHWTEAFVVLLAMLAWIPAYVFWILPALGFNLDQ